MDCYYCGSTLNPEEQKWNEAGGNKDGSVEYPICVECWESEKDLNETF